MNEQLIKDIWWKARIGYNEQNCDPEVLAKFAELLEKEFEAKHFSEGYLQGQSDGIKDTVRDCLNIIDGKHLLPHFDSHVATEPEDPIGKGWWRAQESFKNVIKGHFGVEE